MSPPREVSGAGRAAELKPPLTKPGERRPKEKTNGCDVQRVWLYCNEGKESDDVMTACKKNRRPRMSPEHVEPLTAKAWRERLQLHIHALPQTYGRGDWEEFLTDAAMLLVATMESCKQASALRREDSQRGSQQAMRWPGLLVTDRQKLFESSLDLVFRQALAQTGRFRICELLPVVLAADFGFVSGCIVDGPPVKFFQSPTFSPPEEGEEPAPVAEEVPIHPGVFLQHYNAPDVLGRPGIYGSRCFALLDDGMAAYSSVSADGLRGTEAFGRWEVLNGHVVLQGSKEKSCHFHFQGRRRHLLQDVGFDELIHIPIQELAKSFETPMDLAECIPRGGKRLRLLLLGGAHEAVAADLDASEDAAQARAQERPGAESPPPPPMWATSAPQFSRPASRGSGAPSSLPYNQPRPCSQQTVRSRQGDRQAMTPSPFNGTFGNLWDTPVRYSPELPEESAEVVTEQQHTSLGDSPGMDDTSMHALLKLSSFDDAGEAAQPQPVPLLLGTKRGMSMVDDNRFMFDRQVAHVMSSGAKEGEQVSDELVLFQDLRAGTMQRLTGLLEAFRGRCSASAAQRHKVCPLRLGRYSYEHGSRKAFSYVKFELKLLPDGSCDFFEARTHSTVRSISGSTVWSVTGGRLLLSARKPDGHSFVLCEEQGHKTVKRFVKSIVLSVRLVKQKCSHESLPQIIDPFPGHHSQEAADLVFGMVDPQSPVIFGMRCKPDHLPYHAFEEGLRRHNFPTNDILSDFRFLDRDEDGQVSVKELTALEAYGCPVASPETLHAFREALVAQYGTPIQAFEAMKQRAGADSITLAKFEDFLAQFSPGRSPSPLPVASTPSNRPKSPGERAKLEEWMENSSEEDIRAVFASLNPTNANAIDAGDFMSLSLNTALLAVRRVEHFQGWIFEHFGRSQDDLKKLFNSMNVDPAEDKKKSKGGSMHRKLFLESAERLQYPGGEQALGNVFALMDRNFDAEISVKDFQMLCDFNAEELLRQLMALKGLVEQKLGGIDPSFRLFLEKEKLAQNLQTMPKIASFDSFKKVVGSAGFGKGDSNADLKLLFVFLTEASGKHADGFMRHSEWALLKGLSSRALTGSPARLRKLLTTKYPSMEAAFERMHTHWLERCLIKGLKQCALGGIARALAIQAQSRGQGGISLPGTAAGGPRSNSACRGGSNMGTRPASQMSARPASLPMAGVLGRTTPDIGGSRAASAQGRRRRSSGKAGLPGVQKLVR